jgi:hypothetical protein
MGVPGSDARLGLQTVTQGAVFYVDRYHGDANDSNDGTNPNAPLLTIQGGVNKCAAFHNDTVSISPGNSWQYGALPLVNPYAEEVVINTPGIRLVGVHPSSVNGVVWTPAQDRGTCLTINALDVLVEGFIFTGGVYISPTAIVAYWDGGTIKGDNLVVRNCVFESEVNTAIDLRYVWYADIYQNCFWFNPLGIYANPGFFAPSDLQIHDNLFHECGNALDLVNVEYSFIYRNLIYCQAAALGINAANRGINTMNGTGNLVNDNTFSCLLARYNDFCTAGNMDAWVNNHCIDGPTIANPT